MLRSHRYKLFSGTLLSSTSALALGLGLSPAAWAGEAPPSQEAQALRLEEIVVTARRVEENVQKVPITVVAVTEESLSSQNIVNLEDYQKVTPGLVTTAGFQGDWFWLRGLQGVARFFADAPADPALTGTMFDIDNVQLLKGPQGTLFGGSSVAGAIVSNPKKPTDHYEGYVDGILGDYGRRTIQGALGGPIVGDKLMFRVAFDSLYRKGYMCDSTSGKCYNDENHYVIRGGLMWRPTDTIESYTMFQYFYERNNGQVRDVAVYDPNLNDSYNVWYKVIALIQGGGNLAAGVPAATKIADALLAQGKFKPYDLAAYGTGGYKIQQGFSGQKKREYLVVNNTSWDITDKLQFRNIFEFRHEGISGYYFDNWNDSFFGFLPNDPRAVATISGPLPMANTWSDEAKLTGKLFDDFMNFTVGTYHKGEPQKMILSWSDTAGSLQASYAKGSSRYPRLTRAVFGQSDFDIGRYVGLDGLTFTAGYRYTWDTMHNETHYLNVLPGVPTAQLPGRGDLYGTAHFKDDNWLFGLKWQYNPDTMFYFTASKAYTVGQINPADGPQYQTVNPEKLTQLEGGVKSTFDLGGAQIRTNFEGYYGWYTNIQVSVLRSRQINPPPAPISIIVPSVNAAEGLTRGFDAELDVIPVSWFELSANGAYNANKYTNWPVLDPITGVVIGNQKNTVYVGTPNFVWNLTGTFHVPPSWLDERYGKLSVSAHYEHVSSTSYYAGANVGDYAAYTTLTAANGFGPLSADGSRVFNSGNEPYQNLDADIRWVDPMGVKGLTSTFGVTNITGNLEGYDGAYGYYSFGLQWKGKPPPRMYTLELKYSF